MIDPMPGGAVKTKWIVVVLAVLVLGAVFLAGMMNGYHRGYTDGANQTNGWWIDKKTRYYESGEIIKKRIHRQHNHV